MNDELDLDVELRAIRQQLDELATEREHEREREQLLTDIGNQMASLMSKLAQRADIRERDKIVMQRLQAEWGAALVFGRLE